MRDPKKDKIQIGKKVDIVVLGDEKYPDRYTSKIDDVDEKTVCIGLPIKKGVVIPLRIGSKLKISMLEDDAIYSFSGELKSRVRKPYPYFKMDYPKKISREQRRNYVRVSLNLVVEVIIKGEEKDREFKAVTLNLSGGGMYIISGVKIKREEEVYVKFRLPDGTESGNIKIEIRREEEMKEDNKVRYKYGMLFKNINLKISDAIVSYLFEVQRDRRRKGIKI
ncbi:MAG: hypothetical protein B6I28_05315 [Fusobacteriia bacterium 4572_132]|nr:MAG: hypothetical protein B6I28_05315 [Fusobacteriia bacterium 4572_132]